MNTTSMRAVGALLLMFALCAPGAAVAALIVTTHDATSLIGTFSLSGEFEQDQIAGGPSFSCSQ